MKKIIFVLLFIFSFFLLNAERPSTSLGMVRGMVRLSNHCLAYAETISLTYLDSFDQADSDRDGYLSFEETQNSNLLDEGKFSQADTDTDGLLSLSEVKQTNLQKSFSGKKERQEVLSEQPLLPPEVTKALNETIVSPDEEEAIIEEQPLNKKPVKYDRAPRRLPKARGTIGPRGQSASKTMKGHRPTRLFGGRVPRGTKKAETSPPAETQNSEE